MMLMVRASIEEIATKIIKSGQVEVRDVDGGTDPFIYSTGNRGPGYLMIKGLVGQPEILKFLTRELAHMVVEQAEFDFIEGNATGGMIPGWQLRNDVSDILRKEVPFCYLRGTRKEGGHGELITGDRNNPLIKKGMRALVVEELVNYAGTTTNAAKEFRDSGYPVSHAACILTYDHAESNERLRKSDVTLISLITLPQLLKIGEETGQISCEAVESYRAFLSDPTEWQLQRGLVVPKATAKKAKEKGYQMRELSFEEAVEKGAPEGKLKEGVVYCVKE